MGFKDWCSRLPRFGSRLTHSPWFEAQIRKSFDEVDVDKDGALDLKELFIALLRLYDLLNATLPCHITIPSLARINQLMAEHDKDKDGRLHFPEYASLARSLVGTRKSWRQSLPFKIAVAVLLKTVGFPYGGRVIRESILGVAALAGLRNDMTEKLVPAGVAAFALETAVKPLYNA